MPHAFLFEVGFWGLPFGALGRDFRDTPQLALGVFTRERLPSARARVWVSSRRIALLVDGIPESQPDQTIEIRGPKASVAYDFNRLPTPAAHGFASAQGVESKDLFIKDVDGEKFLFARRGTKGKPAADLIPKLIPAIVATFPWLCRPWAAEMLFPQPPAYICALLDDRLLPCVVDGVTPGRETGLLEGGVFRKISVPTASEYPGIMHGLGLSPLPSDRQKQIESHFQSIVATGGTIRKERQHLDRITFEVERPQPVTLNLTDEIAAGLPEPVYLQILCDSPAYLPIESSRGGMTAGIVGFVEKRSLAPNEIEVRTRELTSRLKIAADLWREDKSRPLDELAAGLRLLPSISGGGTLYDAALTISRKAQFLSGMPGLSENMQEALIDRVILLTMSEYGFSTVRRFPALAGQMLPLVAEVQGMPPETVAILRDTAGCWAGREIVPESRTALLCSLAGLLTKLRNVATEPEREALMDRIIALLDAKSIYIDIYKALDGPENPVPQGLWLDALGRRMQREGLDIRRFGWLSADDRLDPASFLDAARTWKEGPPPDTELLRTLLQRLQTRLASFPPTELPYQAETAPEKALAGCLERLEKPQCLSLTGIYTELVAGRIEAEACLMDLPETSPITPDVQRRVSLLHRFRKQLLRLPFLATAGKPMVTASAGGAA
ncbi:MAG TPA: glycine--tRNA ligase subunit beta [Candidatus Ozemobacteraceae bacterium]